MIRSRPFLIDDMEALVLACAAEPIRLRIEEALVPLPDEILSFSEYNPETRLGESCEIVAIDCGDRETAARVTAIGGRGFRLAGDALVVVTEGTIRPALSRKLAAAGIFVDARGGGP